MSRKWIHYIMLLPILAATWRSFGSEVPATIAPDRVISWTALTALQEEAAATEVTDATPTPADVSEG